MWRPGIMPGRDFSEVVRTIGRCRIMKFPALDTARLPDLINPIDHASCFGHFIQIADGSLALSRVPRTDRDFHTEKYSLTHASQNRACAPVSREISNGISSRVILPWQ